MIVKINQSVGYGFDWVWMNRFLNERIGLVNVFQHAILCIIDDWRLKTLTE